MVGRLPLSGLGAEREYPPMESLGKLRSTCGERNAQLVASLKEDKHGATLLQTTLDDSRLGRMTAPAPISMLGLESINLAMRFGVEQGYTDSMRAWKIYRPMLKRPRDRFASRVLRSFVELCCTSPSVFFPFARTFRNIIRVSCSLRYAFTPKNVCKLLCSNTVHKHVSFSSRFLP